jgi:uncharacterized heparinase superfamily protein
MLRKSYKLMQKTRDMIEQTRLDMTRMTFASSLYAKSLDHQSPKTFTCCPPDPWTGDAVRGAELMTYVMDQRPEQLQALTAPQWFDRVDANFHAFAWLLDLRAQGSDDARVAAARLVDSWIDQNAGWNEKTWDLNLMGERILRLIGAYAFMLPALDPERNEKLAGNLARQGRHLKRVLGSHTNPVEGLHAAVGLTAAGIALGHDPYWIEQGLKQINKICADFILPDGGCVTRKAQDLCTVLRLLHETHLLLASATLPVPSFLTHTIDRVVPALRFMRLSDHKLAVFHGASEHDPLVIEDLLLKSGVTSRAPLSLRYTGFEKLVGGQTHVIMDTGERGLNTSDNQHASTLAFEMTNGEDRIIVNCGQHAHDEMWRDLLAASAAHSTLTLDGMDNTPMRGTPQRVDVERAEYDTGYLVQAHHDGYVTRNGFVHQRRLFLDNTGTDLRGEDDVGVAIPPVAPITYTLRFHLHPKITAVMTGDHATVLIKTASGAGWRFQHDGQHITLDESIYLGATGLPQKTRQIVVTGKIYGAAHKVKWALRAE